MIIPHLNSFGKANGSPYFIKGEIVPLIDEFSIPVIEKCLSDISEKTNLKWFEDNGLFFLHSIKWEEHQDLRKSRLGDDVLPEYSRTTPGLLPAKVEVKEEVKDKEKSKPKKKNIPPLKPVYDLKQKAKEIIDFLNAKTGYRYRHGDENLKNILSRLKESESQDECMTKMRQVIAMKRREWIDNPDMKTNLNPTTLFRKSNFSRYVGQLFVVDDPPEISKPPPPNQLEPNLHALTKGIGNAMS